METERSLEVWRRYEKALARAGAVDFGDLLLRPAQLLEGDAELRARWSTRFRHVLVDEFQDTNPAQYRLLRLLCGERRNVCVVGDDDQAIYRWRGADVGNILDFDQDFPGTQVVKLEQNYRSTANVLAAAHAVISRATRRREKKLWTTREAGAPLALLVAQDEHEEAQRIAAAVEAERHRGTRGDEIAVLYRVNAQSRPIEAALRGGPGSLRHRPRHQLLRAGRGARRGGLAAARPQPVLRPRPAAGGEPPGPRHRREDARAAPGLRGRGGAHPLRRGGTPRRDRRPQGRGAPQPGGVPRGGGRPPPRRAGPRRRRGGAGGASPGVDCSSGSAPRGPTSPPTRPRTCSSWWPRRASSTRPSPWSAPPAIPRSRCRRRSSRFLEQIALIGDADGPTPEGRVALMTLHAAKGLEFEAVFLCGMEEGMLPYERPWRRDAGDGERSAELDEERRLCYVGMTRAKSRLVLSLARRRMAYGDAGPSWREREPSRFLGDLPPELFGLPSRPPARPASTAPGGPPPPRRPPRRAGHRIRRRARRPASGDASGIVPGRIRPAPPSTTPSTSAPTPDARHSRRVTSWLHPSLGEGLVRACDGVGPDAKVTVVFPGDRREAGHREVPAATARRRPRPVRPRPVSRRARHAAGEAIHVGVSVHPPCRELVVERGRAGGGWPRPRAPPVPAERRGRTPAAGSSRRCRRPRAATGIAPRPAPRPAASRRGDAVRGRLPPRFRAPSRRRRVACDGGRGAGRGRPRGRASCVAPGCEWDSASRAGIELGEEALRDGDVEAAEVFGERDRPRTGGDGLTRRSGSCWLNHDRSVAIRRHGCRGSGGAAGAVTTSRTGGARDRPDRRGDLGGLAPGEAEVPRQDLGAVLGGEHLRELDDGRQAETPVPQRLRPPPGAPGSVSAAIFR